MNERNKQRQKKWFWYDTLLLVLEVASPVVSILCSVFIPGTSVDGRVAIIVGGFTIQMILISIQNKLSNISILEIVKKNGDILFDIEKTVQIADEIKKINETGDKHRIDYFQRRLDEFERTLQNCVPPNSTSGRLDVRVYYNELYNMAEQLLNDKNPLNCFIWAMTGFSELEWSNNGWEQEWSRRLKELTNKKIRTKRVCLISNEILRFLKCRNKEEFTSILNYISDTDRLSANEARFKSFADYLKDNDDELIESYCLYQNNEAYTELIIEKGFFAITLSNGEKYLTKGESLTVANGLTGEYVFDEKLISKIYELHTRICVPAYKLLDEVNKIISPECKSFLVEYGVKL